LGVEGWYWLKCETVGRDALAKTLKMFSVGRDVRSEDITLIREILCLIVHAAREALDVVPPDGEQSFVEGEHGIYVATDLGVDIVCPTGQADAVRDALAIEPVAEEAAECLRIESGRPRYGLDMGPSTIPEEA